MDPTLTKAEFTRLYAQAAAAELKDAQIRITGTLEITITGADGFKLKSSLDNVWAEAANNVKERPKICRHYLSGISAIAKQQPGVTGAADTNSIVAVIKDDLFLQQFANDTSPGRPVSESFVADLNIVYATDRAGLIAFLMESDRKKFNLNFPDLRKLAVTNLRRILPPIKRLGNGPVFAFQADGAYESSLLLSEKLWEGQATSVEGYIVVAMPSRDVLLFTGSGSVAGIKEIREKIEDVHKSGSHLISKTLLIRKNGRWEKFVN